MQKCKQSVYYFSWTNNWFIIWQWLFCRRRENKQKNGKWLFCRHWLL